MIKRIFFALCLCVLALNASVASADQVREVLAFTDLEAFGSSPNAVRSAFTKKYGTEPDGITLNKETYFGAKKPAVTERYGYPAYKTVGQYKLTTISPSPEPKAVVVGENTVVNHGDEEATISLTVGGKLSDTVGWSFSSTNGLKFNTKISVVGAFQMGSEFSFSTTAGESKSSTVMKTVESTVSVKVPPESKVKVQMIAHVKEEKIEFSAPVRVSGFFGANFSKPVDRHYYWFMDVQNVLPRITAEIVGTITGASMVDIYTEIGKAEPI